MKRLQSQKLGRLSTDSFQNFAAKIGLGTANLSSGNTYGFNPISRNRTLIEWMYRGSWICGVGVDVVADDMTREWVEIKSGVAPKDVQKLYALMRHMQIPQSFNAMSKWARLYGGAVCVIVIEGQRLDTPLRLETVKKGQFKGLVTLDRWMLTPNLNSAVRDPGPDFGNPEWYDITTQTPNLPIPRQRVHYTRLARMEGAELPFWQKQAENMWGMSVLERLYDRLTAFDSTTQGAAQLVFRAYLRTLSVTGLRDIIAAGGDAYAALTRNIELIRLYQSNEGMTLLDAQDKLETQTYTFAGLNDVLSAMGEQISGALQVPLTRLFGQSPSGLNADGDSAMRTYEDNIKRQQERWYRRPLDVIIPLCAINAGVELEPGWEYDFRSIRQMTDEQKSKINGEDVTALVAAQGTGLVPGNVFLKELRQSGAKTGRWSNITDQDIGDAAVNDLVPSPESLGVVPPGKQALQTSNGEHEESSESGNPDNVTRNATHNQDKAVLVDVQGIPIFLENHVGDTRTGGSGKNRWKVKMPADYGFIEGVGSAEGAFEQLDCFVGTNHDAPDVYIIDQLNAETGEFDEHKCMLGFDSVMDANNAYLQAFSDGKGPQRLGCISAISMDQFKQWLRDGDHTTPAKEQF